MNSVRLLIFYFFISFRNVHGTTSSGIPEYLLHCYQTNATEIIPKPPLTVQVLVELIRKLEFDKGQPHIRVLSNQILHTVKLDGIQRGNGLNSEIINYRAIGPQFYKHQFIVDHLTPGDNELFPWDSISDEDVCILHYIISNSIDLWKRGDEKRTCQTSRYMPLTENSNLVQVLPMSECPIEMGVIKSKWGSVSSGHIISGIASALQRDTLLISNLGENVNNISKDARSESLDNVLVSTIVGDLAEVVIHQATAYPKLGHVGYWNDTLLPQYYFQNDNNWDLSEAEMIGGIDAWVLASQVKDWTSRVERTRLSQLIDMYYSKRGVSFDRLYKACGRGKKLKELLGGINLEEEVSATAKTLQNVGSYGPFLPEDIVDQFSNAVAEKYKLHTETINDECLGNPDNEGRSEIIVVLDETWMKHDAEKFLAYFSELMDISFYGSKIGVINGQSGAWLTNITSDLVQLFTDLSTKNSWPNALTLTKSLHTVISYYQNKSSYCEPYQRPYGSVILIMAQSSTISDADITEAMYSLESIHGSNPETKLIYVTSVENGKTFDGIISGENAVLVKTTDPDNVEAVVDQIIATLNNKTANIINFYCNTSQTHFEDYLTPGYEILYEIQNEYVSATSNMTVKFKGNGYGDISICGYDVKSMDKRCRGITVYGEVSFNIKDQCSDGESCTVQFAVSANNSLFKCSEIECRFPDQIRMDIYTSWTSSARNTHDLSYLLTIQIFYLLFKLLNMY